MTITIPAEVEDLYNDTITRSMNFLDDYLGGIDWVNEIDLEALDLECATQCVCGQLFDAETGVRTIEGMDNEDGYAYALKHVVEHGVPEEVRAEYEDEAEHVARSKMAEYLGFCIDSDSVDDLIAKGNGYENAKAMWDDDGVDEIPHPWDLLTKTWTERIEKRRAELGTMA